MKMELIQPGMVGQPVLQLSHRKETLIWDVGMYVPRSPEKALEFNSNRLFEEINAFWEYLPMEKQDALWSIYQYMHNVLETNYDIAAITTRLLAPVKQLYDIMTLDDIRHWRAFHSRIRIPGTLKDEYGPDDPPDRIYLRSHYIELVVLVIALRAMVPVWGAYINNTRDESGNMHKEYMAMHLLRHSSLVSDGSGDGGEFDIHDIKRQTPMQRLTVFVDGWVHHILERGPSATVILGGLGSTELPEWVLANTVIRKLAISEISATDDASNVITNVYNFISNALKSMDKKIGGRFGGKVNEKNPPSSSAASEEANASIVEMYKVKQKVTDGDLVALNVFTEQPEVMAVKVDPTLNLSKLAPCFIAVQVLENQPIYPHQTLLTQWVMAPALSARSIPLLSKPALLRAMCVTQALLWHWECFDLAVLVTATPLIPGAGEVSASLESRGPRIPKDLLEELQVKYPHYQQPRPKQSTARQVNVASKAIDGFCDMVVRSDWYLNAPIELVALSSRLPNSRKLIVPSDIRAQLANLILHRIAK